MTTPSPSLAEFLLARVAEDEQIAREATPGPWTAYGDGILLGTSSNPEVCRGVKTWNMWHLSTFDPARVLAQCAAVRAVVEMHKSWPVLVEQQPTLEQTDISDINAVAFRMSKQIQWLTEQEYRNKFGAEPPTSPILRALAAVYAEHQGYRAEWAV